MNAEEMSQQQPGEVVSTDIETESEVRSLKKEIAFLKHKSAVQDLEIKSLKEQQSAMNDRLRAQERYTRKDSVMVYNPPFDARNCENVTLETLKFFRKFINVNLHIDRIKACHIIPNTGNKGTLPTVVCKFIYFEDKQAVFGNRRLLKKARNAINNKYMFINELLPEVEANIQQEANKRNFITSTHNCAVSVLIENGKNKPKFVKVNEISDLEKLPAIKRSSNYKNDNLRANKRHRNDSF